MNWDQIAGNWKQFEGKARQRWAKLTEDDLALVAGKRKELEGKLQEAYGMTREEAKREVDEFAKSAKAASRDD